MIPFSNSSDLWGVNVSLNDRGKMEGEQVSGGL